MLYALILVCAVGATSCDRDTAVDVLATPVMSANPATCFMHGQAYLAGTEVGRTLPDGSRVMVVCAPQRRR